MATMGTFIFTSSSKTLHRPKCVYPAVTIALIVLAALILNFTALVSFYSYTPTVADHPHGFPHAGLRLEAHQIEPREAHILSTTGHTRKLDGVFKQERLNMENLELEIQETMLQGPDKVEHAAVGEPSPKAENVLTLETKSAVAEEPVVQAQLSVTIHTAPIEYSGDVDDPKRQALLSWLHLHPRPHVVLLGNHPSLHEIAREFLGVVNVESDIDYSFNGAPMFHSMVARSHFVNTNVSVLINADVVLLQSFMSALHKTAALSAHWVLAARRLEVERFPYTFVRMEDGSVRLETTKGEWVHEQEVADFVGATGELRIHGHMDWWAWSASRGRALLRTPMPPFTFGGGSYDKWMMHRILAEETYALVDASEALVSFRLPHGDNADNTATSSAKRDWNFGSRNRWQAFSNAYLLQLGRNSTFPDFPKIQAKAPMKLLQCREPATTYLCLVGSVKGSSYACQCRASTVSVKKTDFEVMSHHIPVGAVPLDFSPLPSPASAPASAPGLPHTLNRLLPQVADASKTVVLVAVSAAYKEMLLSFVCRGRALGVENILIAALDEDLYWYAFSQGLPVYYEPTAAPHKYFSKAKCVFGSHCFRAVTKLKSRAVLHILKKGYNVLWSDVDIVWFRNPLSHMTSYGPGTLPVQSDEPDSAIPGNSLERINSGFYYAHADNVTIAAFTAIVKHAKTSNTSEQPSFYHVLCGSNGERVISDSECRYGKGLRTIFLDRNLFPNGVVHGIWWHENVTTACLDRGCYILHNNWIAGKQLKTERQVRNRLWYYDVASRMCIHQWHPLTSLDSGQFFKHVMSSLIRL